MFWTTAVFAACPGDAGEALPPREQLPALEVELARLAEECGSRPGYLAYRGAVLNALGRPAEGAALLEQALFLDPNRAGAQIDYAEALAALGDIAAAASMLRQVLARADVPEQLRPPLERRLNAIEALQRFDLSPLSILRAWPGTEWRTGGSISLRLGHDNNLNSAPSRDTLALTLPGGDVILTLADRFRARGGSVAMAEANGQVVRPLEGGATLQIYGEGRLRGTSSASDTNYQQLQAVVARSQPLATGEALFSLGTAYLHYGGSTLYEAARVAASRDWRINWLDGCRPGAGAETEWRRYPAARELDGRFMGASAGIWCGRGLDRLTVAARFGQDAAERDRPGGDQRLADLRFSWIGPVRGGSLYADLILTRQQDADGYSPLLENGATRRIDRLSMRLEYAYPVTPNWAVLGTLDVTEQRSNLPLFDISGRAVYLGVRWTPVR